ncbi:ABC transporter permease/substrate-binding protein [Aliifodinibius sp. S!AR15-10]|uniref:ABC transporter permease/substrate-binding protein n=1 Tax=Aliifodinibius sp. S!AR15-10 TaxID=2950437 RepID=UPI00286532D4|nr:ABC transporter permease/substrate-binding protein [Aliifodinibius sp. S!AR15-10]MDR8392014.1 ABC transporter permease/substrate-binding protein [Aliifodinibius sp. S!AR15-10]
MLNLWNFILENRNEIVEQTGEHIGLTLVALAIALAIGIPLSLYLTRNRKIAGTVLGAVGVIQTIPSIALLGFLLPLLGIGATPAIVALFLYALLPIVRNTYAGIDEVDPAVLEAARGMGMTDGQVLRKVELPLAVPVIFAGIRTATVINVGVATLCALIGAGGLGEYIFRGIALNNMDMILAGAFPAAALALIFDYILGLIERNIRNLIKPLLYGAAFMLVLAIPWSLNTLMQEDPFQAGMPPEFIERPDGYRGLKEHYGFDLPTVEMEAALMYRALRNGKVDVIGGYSTDGRIEAYDLKVLKDDKNYFPPYDCAALVSNQVLEQNPELERVLDLMEGKIATREMIQLNNQVDQQHRSPQEVARDFLMQEGFDIGEKREGEPDILVGGKNFTEHFILGHMLALHIESQTDLTVGTRLGLAGTKIVFDALTNAEIDLYPEYTGTGLHVLLDASPSVTNSLGNSPEAVYQYVKEQSQERFNLRWLQPFGFENTYALMMRREHADRLGIETISDLVEYLEE